MNRMFSAPAKIAAPETWSCEYCVPAVVPPIATSYAPEALCVKLLIERVPAAGISPASVTPELATLFEIEPVPEIVPVLEVLTPFETLKLPSTCAMPPLTAKVVTESLSPVGI